MPHGAIAQAAGPWRSSGGWWTEARRAEGTRPGDRPGDRAEEKCGAFGETPWNRDEWDVALKSGAVCRIYQNRTTDRWFLEGVYD